ncbi:MAG: hypothetical protein FJ403_06660 [Verrucomicrobia bacterium]|nr:hypothetical protein [Verrucomicrobiota bacterium]
MRANEILFGVLLFASQIIFQQRASAQPTSSPPQDGLTKVLAEELDYSMRHLVTEDKSKPYYLGFTVTDNTTISLTASLGALFRNDDSRQRLLDVDLRVGDFALDSTHQIRGGAGGRGGFGGSSAVPLENDPIAVKQAIWQTTDRAFKSAVERFQRVKTDLKTTVEEESKAHDFSREEPSVCAETDAVLSLDREQ